MYSLFNLNLHFTVNGVNDTSTAEENELSKMCENLKAEEKIFTEERVNVPSPYLVHEHIFKLHKLLRDETYRLQFLPILYNTMVNADSELEAEEIIT